MIMQDHADARQRFLKKCRKEFYYRADATTIHRRLPPGPQLVTDEDEPWVLKMMNKLITGTRWS